MVSCFKPPYVVRKDINRLSNDIKKFEPKLALDGGNDGLDVIKKFCKSKNVLKLNGILALEIGRDNTFVVNVLKENGLEKREL